MQSAEQSERTNNFTHLLPVFVEMDAMIHRLEAKEFVTDPVVETRYSRITTIVSSAYKRHGAIIEKAFVAAVRESPHLTVWAEPDSRVSAAAERLADGDATASGSALSYLQDDYERVLNAYERVLQVDLLVFDGRDQSSGHMNASEASDTTTRVRSDRCYGIFGVFRCFLNPTERSGG